MIWLWFASFRGDWFLVPTIVELHAGIVSSWPGVGRGGMNELLVNPTKCLSICQCILPVKFSVGCSAYSSSCEVCIPRQNKMVAERERVLVIPSSSILFLFTFKVSFPPHLPMNVCLILGPEQYFSQNTWISYRTSHVEKCFVWQKKWELW